MTIRAVILDGPSYDKGGDQGGEGRDRYKAYFDMDKFSLPLAVRSRRPGDHFCPRGMGGKRKKIKEYFIDLKVLRRDREIIPVLASAEGILWIIGHRTDERFKVTPAAEKILQVTAFKNAA
jgi:tRNA(Ile)-lysidine synthase